MITPLNTPRLTIRRFRSDDAADLHDYLSDPRVYRFEPGEPLDRDQASQRAVDPNITRRKPPAFRPSR
jgi:RimJ/RimL family protein N-acetyltransferase